MGRDWNSLSLSCLDNLTLRDLNDPPNIGQYIFAFTAMFPLYKILEDPKNLETHKWLLPSSLFCWIKSIYLVLIEHEKNYSDKIIAGVRHINVCTVV